MTHQLSAGDAGTGWVGTTSGVAVFLFFMLLSAHVLVHLHTTTVVSTAALTAARTAASADVGHDNPVATSGARALAEQRARSVLGGVGDSAVFDWSGSTDTAVVVEVHISGPRLVPAQMRTVLFAGEVRRAASVRVEAPR